MAIVAYSRNDLVSSSPLCDGVWSTLHVLLLHVTLCKHIASIADARSDVVNALHTKQQSAYNFYIKPIGLFYVFMEHQTQ